MAERTAPAPLRRRRRLGDQRLQLILVLAGLGLGLALPRITAGPQTPSAQVIDLLFTLGFGVLGVTGLIFSLLFLVVQWAHANFSPRLLLFRRAPIVWRTFGAALSMAVFCITAALAVGGDPQISAAVPVVAGILLLVMLVLLRNLQMRALASIQLAPVLHSITQQGHDVIDALYRPRAGQVGQAGQAGRGEVVLPTPTENVTWPAGVCVLQEVDMDLLVATARHGDAVIALRAVPGVALTRGAVVAEVHGPPLPAAAVLAALITGAEETFEQDPFLAFRLLSDIVMRALSPAVNDPATAIQGIDHVEDLLGAVPVEHDGPLHVADQDGALRVTVQLPGWEDFARLSLDGTIHAALGSPTVLLRIRGLLLRLRTLRPSRDQALIARRLAWVERELAERFPLLWSESESESAPR
jgi:uncharacterized membrane protein